MRDIYTPWVTGFQYRVLPVLSKFIRLLLVTPITIYGWEVLYPVFAAERLHALSLGIIVVIFPLREFLRYTSYGPRKTANHIPILFFGLICVIDLIRVLPTYKVGESIIFISSDQFFRPIVFFIFFVFIDGYVSDWLNSKFEKVKNQQKKNPPLKKNIENDTPYHGAKIISINKLLNKKDDNTVA